MCPSTPGANLYQDAPSGPHDRPLQELSRPFYVASGWRCHLGWDPPFEAPVIPVPPWRDGNDCGLQRPGLANDASTRLSCPDVFGRDCPAPTKLSSTFWYAEKGGRGCPSLLEGGRACGRTRHMSSPSDWTPPKRFSWFATSLPREEGDGCYLRQKDRSAPAAPPLECLKQKQFRGQRAFEAHRDTLLR
jgi:hypothetical protein